jgi:hypothetical protein
MPHGYRCPFCQSTRPAQIRHVRSPLGTLAQILSLLIGLPLLVWGFSFWAKHYALTLGLSAGATLVLGVGVATLVAYVLFAGPEQALRTREQVCPDCKMRLS